MTLTLQTPQERDKVVARGPAPTSESGETTLMLEEPASADPSKPATSPAHLELLVAHLTGTDAIAADDSAPVVVEASPGTVAVVADAVDELAVTGGPPVVEQALAALELDIAVRPIPALPDRSEDLAPFAGAILDDPPGFTPEERRALGTFLEGGGAVLLALGPRAAAAPLGASLEPIIPHAILWGGTPVPGADASSAVGTLAESAQSLEDLAAKARATLAPEDVGGFEPLLKWGDGSILVAKRAIGRGEAWIVTLPFAIDASDLPVRPAFLALLDAWASEARARAAPRRTDVGVAWTFPGARSVEVEVRAAVCLPPRTARSPASFLLCSAPTRRRSTERPSFASLRSCRASSICARARLPRPRGLRPGRQPRGHRRVVLGGALAPGPGRSRDGAAPARTRPGRRRGVGACREVRSSA